jgi:hypothetical protein
MGLHNESVYLETDFVHEHHQNQNLQEKQEARLILVIG